MSYNSSVLSHVHLSGRPKQWILWKKSIEKWGCQLTRFTWGKNSEADLHTNRLRWYSLCWVGGGESAASKQQIQNLIRCGAGQRWRYRRRGKRLKLRQGAFWNNWAKYRSKEAFSSKKQRVTERNSKMFMGLIRPRSSWY